LRLALAGRLTTNMKLAIGTEFVGLILPNFHFSMGQPVYKALEDNDCCTRQFCGNIRPFELSITDFNNEQNEVSSSFSTNQGNFLR